MNFRRAIAHAIDKRRIITEVMNGLAVEQHGPLSPSLRSYYFDAVPRYPYDLEKARKLLEKAGFRPEKPHGKLRDSQGNPLEFDLHTSIHRQDNIKIWASSVKTWNALGSPSTSPPRSSMPSSPV